MQLTKNQRHAILRSAKEPQKNIKIEILPGIMLAPQSVGESYYWTTPGGQICRYPQAYVAHFGRPIYHASTRRVIVGEQWVLADAV